MRNVITIALLLIALRSVGQDEVIRPLMITDSGEIVNATHQRIAGRIAATNGLVRTDNADLTNAVARAAALSTGAVLKVSADFTNALGRATTATGSSYTNAFVVGADTHTITVINGKIESWVITQ
jgi:hypothetical protein